MKKIVSAMSTGFLSALLLLSGCTADTPTAPSTAPTAPTTAVSDASVMVNAVWEDEDKNGAPDITNATVITLADGASAVAGAGAVAEKNVVTVQAGGTYVVKGALSNGQLRVESADDTTVRLVLDGVSIHSNTTAPLFIKKSAKTIITLAEGSKNELSDSENAVYEDEENQEPSAALFSKSDLTINGDGALTVTAAFNDGIVSRDGLKIAGGAVAVTAADDAVMGRDYVLVGGGAWMLTASGDGVKSTNDAGDAVGFIRIEGGGLTVISEKDGIQAESSLTVTGGTVDITAGGGSQNGNANVQNDFGWGQQSADSESVGKGLKAGGNLSVADANVHVNAADDGIHSNQAITLSSGNIFVAAGDDGIHADDAVTIVGGTILVNTSYEALEAGAITIDGGDITLKASDDGINASKGSEGSTGDPYGGNPFASDDSALIINGGKLTIDAMGDGLDSNGTVVINGGEIYVCGPSNSGNGTLDFGASFTVNGGTLVGVGSMGMAEMPTENAQNSIVWNGCSLSSGDRLTVTAADGTVIASITSARSAQWAYITTPLFTVGETYTVSDGESAQTLTLQSGANTIGTASGGMHGGFPGGRPPDGGFPGGGFPGGRP